jgi:predicted permease
MLSFDSLSLKLLPLFILIAIGFLFVKLLKEDFGSISKLLFYIVSPIVIFDAGLKTDISPSLLISPLILCLSASLVCLASLKIGACLPRSEDRALLSYCAGASNTGYFGLPLIGAILGESAFRSAVVVGMGMILFEFTLGFYQAARGRHSVWYSLAKLMKAPHLYAFGIGLICNQIGLADSSIINDSSAYFRGAYTLLGMMIIGMGLSSIKVSSIDYKFITLNLFCKSILFPASCFLCLYLVHILGIKLNPLELQILFLLSLTPTAANSVVFAKELGLDASKAVIAVLTSTLLALVALPLFALKLNVIIAGFQKW